MREHVAPDLVIAVLAERQGGVVAYQQLRGLGLSKDAIHHRVATGRLHVIRRGVFAVGHRVIGAVGLRWAAVLACGDGTVLSHRSAAGAWSILASSTRTMHVTVPGHAGRMRRRGIVVHRRPLPADELTTLDGLPITTPARTRLDLAAADLRGRPLEAALDRAERELRVDWADVHRLLERHAGRSGVPALRETLARYAPGEVETLSILEEIVLELCDEYAIPGHRSTPSSRESAATSTGRIHGSWWRLTPTRGTAHPRRSTTTASAMSACSSPASSRCDSATTSAPTDATMCANRFSAPTRQVACAP